MTVEKFTLILFGIIILALLGGAVVLYFVGVHVGEGHVKIQTVIDTVHPPPIIIDHADAVLALRQEQNHAGKLAMTLDSTATFYQRLVDSLLAAKKDTGHAVPKVTATLDRKTDAGDSVHAEYVLPPFNFWQNVGVWPHKIIDTMKTPQFDPGSGMTFIDGVKWTGIGAVGVLAVIEIKALFSKQ